MTDMMRDILSVSAVLGALSSIFGVIFAVYRWYLKQEKRDRDIVRMKEENALICYGLEACLDGLEQLGANHSVPVAKDKLNKYLNQQAHK